MKTKYPIALLVFMCVFASADLTARNPNAGSTKASTSYKNESGGCVMPTSQIYLEINNVRTTLLDGGDLWFDPSSQAASYEVPKASPTSTTASPQAIYAGAIWVSGLDAGNNLKMSAEMYRSNGGVDYYTGPLDNTGNTTLAACNLWDQHFPVWSTQINSVIRAYAAQGNTGTLPLSSISDSVKYWPGKGNPYLSALGYDVSGVLAPFYDADGDGLYDPAHGDYPTVKQGGVNASAGHGYCGSPNYDSACYTHNTGYGDQMVFWVMNDMGNTHNGSFGGQAIGIQVNALAFAFQSNDAINDMTFYRYQIINKSGAVLNKTYISQFTDPDLGCPNNDAVGCDTSRNMAIVYNGVPQNATNTPGYNYVCDMGVSCSQGTVGYGCALPMLGIVMAETPSDTGSAGMRGMSSFCSFVNANTDTGDPSTAQQFRNYQTGYWKDGTPRTFGGNGFANSTTLAPYMYPGDPSIANQWSECNPQIGAPIYASDRRMLQTSGPFTFMPCASQFMSIAVVFVQPVATNCPSWSTIDAAADKALQLFGQCALVSGPAGIDDAKANQIKIYPNPVSSSLFLDNGNGTRIDLVEVYDMVGNIVFSQKGTIKSIDMSSLSDGVYFVKTKEGNKESVLKVVKD